MQKYFMIRLSLIYSFLIRGYFYQPLHGAENLAKLYFFGRKMKTDERCFVEVGQLPKLNSPFYRYYNFIDKS